MKAMMMYPKYALSSLNHVACFMRHVRSVLFFSILFQAGSSAREIHVAKTGKDTNAGSKTAPYLTINKAAAEAMPGDVIMIHNGTYREWVKPARGGSSDAKRITYRAYPGHNPVIKGSEQITTWVKENGNVWRADIPNTFFGVDNPYILTMGTKNHTMSSGARLTGVFVLGGKTHHLGDVYLDGEAYSEKFNRAAVDSASKTWYTEQSGGNTKIWANFGGADPNTRLAEILVRECVFAPITPNLNYITVDGLTLQQAACGWAENNSYQSALMKTKGGHSWIIQRCLISDARCSGISSATHRNDNSDITITGRHIVRNNTIERCGEGGISGMFGWSGSIIEGNLIQNINPKREFGGYEGGGIKVHNSSDLLIQNNIIRNIFFLTGNAPGIWVDWRNQGVRITGNVIYGISGPDAIFLEMNRGVILMDNNVIIDDPVRFGAERTVFAHNLLVNAGHAVFSDNTRTLDYYKPHTLNTVGTPASPIVKLDARDYNNIILNKGLTAGTSGYKADFNVYYNGAKKLPGHDAKSMVEPGFNAAFQRTDLDNGVTIRFNASSAPSTMACPPITYDFIGAFNYPNDMKQGMEDRDGEKIHLNKDMLGNARSKTRPMAGPFENLQVGQNTFTLHAGRTAAAGPSASAHSGGTPRTWTSADGKKTFKGELIDYNPETGKVTVDIEGKQVTFQEQMLSAGDISYLKNGQTMPVTNP